MPRIPTVARALGAVLAAAAAGCAQEAPFREATPAAGLRAGERLVYNVRVGGLTLGTATLAVEAEADCGGEKARRVSLTVKSNSLAAKFKTVDDRAVSHVHARSLHSLGFEATKREGSRTSRETIKPDYKALTAGTVKAREGRDPTERELELPGPVQDAVSWFYALRAMKLVTGVPEELVVATTRRVMPLEVVCSGAGRISVPGHGRLDAIKVVVAGGGEALFGKEGSVTLWLSPRGHVPLRIVVSAGRLSVTLCLKSTSGSPLD